MSRVTDTSRSAAWRIGDDGPFEAEREALHAGIVPGGEDPTAIPDSSGDIGVFDAIVSHLRPRKVTS